MTDEIVCVLELTERERELVNDLLTKEFNRLWGISGGYWSERRSDVQAISAKIKASTADNGDKPRDDK